MSSSSRRSGRSPPSSSAAASEDEIRDFVCKLQQLMPQLEHRTSGRVPCESDVLKETCSYIRKLRGEVEELSDRLSQLLSNTGFTTADVELIKAILLH